MSRWALSVIGSSKCRADSTVGWKKEEENNGVESGNIGSARYGFIMINARALARRAGDASICPSVREGDRE
jgi:hypothetical protein